MTDKTYGNWLKLLLLICIPVIAAQLLARTYWHSGPVENSDIPIGELALTMLGIPVYCLIVARIVQNNYQLNRMAIWSTMLIGIAMSVVLYFANWTESVGNWNTPGDEIQELFIWAFCFAAAMTGLGVLFIIEKRS